MRRDDFVKAFAKRSGLSDEWAILGLIDFADRKLIALPCGCNEPSCEGWVMASAEGVSDHLERYAPEPLRTAYCDALISPPRI